MDRVWDERWGNGHGLIRGGVIVSPPGRAAKDPVTIVMAARRGCCQWVVPRKPWAQDGQEAFGAPRYEREVAVCVQEAKEEAAKQAGVEADRAVRPEVLAEHDGRRDRSFKLARNEPAKVALRRPWSTMWAAFELGIPFSTWLNPMSGGLSRLLRFISGAWDQMGVHEVSISSYHLYDVRRKSD